MSKMNRGLPMMPAEPRTLACPDCGHLHSDPRYRSHCSSSSWLYSDFHREVVSVVVVPPLYVTCLGCAHVHLFIELRDTWRPAGSAALARWVGTTPDEAFAALFQEQPPFFANSGFAHTLRLHLRRTENRRIAEGVPIANAQRREQLLQTLTQECVARSHMPVYQYLLAEMERQRGDFEPAAQRLRNLVGDANTDPLLATHSRLNLEWCLEGRTLQQKFPAPPTVERTPAALGSRPQVYKFVVFVSAFGHIDSDHRDSSSTPATAENGQTMKAAPTSDDASQITGNRSARHSPYLWPVRVLAGLVLTAIVAAFAPMLAALVQQPGRGLLLSVLLHLSLVISLARYLGAISLTGRVTPTTPWAPFSSGRVTAVVAIIVVGAHLLMAGGWDNSVVDAAHSGLASENCSDE